MIMVGRVMNRSACKEEREDGEQQGFHGIQLMGLEINRRFIHNGFILEFVF
jgi:hypothetical protein